MNYYDQVEQATAHLKRVAESPPEVAIVLGSGLSAFASAIDDARAVPYAQIPHWPPSRVVGHEGRLVFGSIGRTRVAVLSGRAHFYEGHSMATVTFPIRVMAMLGSKTLVLTNAAGGVNTAFAAGTLMIIDDHINLMGDNPLVGLNDERFGERFPDMSEVYAAPVRQLVESTAVRLGVPIRHGVYAALRGPSYETPAEVRYLRTIGADAVGMSTVPEAIVARQMRRQVVGISCITNMAAGVLPRPLHHRDVMETAQRVSGQFIGLLKEIVKQL